MINATENPSDYKYENITSVETESQQVQNVVSHKCGKHGKEVFDNMVRKWLCSCTDGYTGKYCNICNGKVEPVLNIINIREPKGVLYLMTKRKM